MKRAEYASRMWDVVVVGAGVSGAVAGSLLAQRGLKVLLIEKARWPREKVCGGCLNTLAVEGLRQAGLGTALKEAQPLNQVIWQVGNNHLTLATRGSCAISRAELDEKLVEEAIAQGCEFLAGVSVMLAPAVETMPYRTLLLRRGEEVTAIQSKTVLACDGLGGTLLAGEAWARWHIAKRAWMGVATMCRNWSGEVPPGTTYMHVDQGGYVGLVRLRDGRVHLAAAMDVRACQQAGGPGGLAAHILRACHRTPPEELKQVRFAGMGLLTRRRNFIGGYRVLAVGDACGYVEPFTGEGMAWAVQSARAVVELISAEGQTWPPTLANRWQTWYEHNILRRQRWCRTLQPLMHHPLLARTGIMAGQVLPALWEHVIVSMGRNHGIQMPVIAGGLQ